MIYDYNLILQSWTAAWTINRLVDSGTQKMTAVSEGLFNIHIPNGFLI